MLCYIIFSLLISLYYGPYSYAEHHNVEKNGQELLICRTCGADVADSHYVVNKLSPGAIKIEKQNLFGRHNISVQTLVNPFGVKFNIITLQKARCQNVGPDQGADSWFPGYTWRICTCPHCGQHLGWTFESKSKDMNVKTKEHLTSFHGLILSNILEENFTDSLVVMPKMYRM